MAIAACCSVPALASPGFVEPTDGTSYAAGTEQHAAMAINANVFFIFYV